MVISVTHKMINLIWIKEMLGRLIHNGHINPKCH